jgi:hypothetical protein
VIKQNTSKQPKILHIHYISWTRQMSMQQRGHYGILKICRKRPKMNGWESLFIQTYQQQGLLIKQQVNNFNPIMHRAVARWCHITTHSTSAQFPASLQVRSFTARESLSPCSTFSLLEYYTCTVIHLHDWVLRAHKTTLMIVHKATTCDWHLLCTECN